MNAELIKQAMWSDEQIALERGPIQTGFQCVAVLVVDGIELKTWLPRSPEDAAAMNNAAQKIVERMNLDLG